MTQTRTARISAIINTRMTSGCISKKQDIIYVDGVPIGSVTETGHGTFRTRRNGRIHEYSTKDIAIRGLITEADIS